MVLSETSSAGFYRGHGFRHQNGDVLTPLLTPLGDLPGTCFVSRPSTSNCPKRLSLMTETPTEIIFIPLFFALKKSFCGQLLFVPDGPRRRMVSEFPWRATGWGSSWPRWLITRVMAMPAGTKASTAAMSKLKIGAGTQKDHVAQQRLEPKWLRTCMLASLLPDCLAPRS